MLDATYFHFQAQRCLRLAYQAKDMRIAAELIRMAEEFTEKADEFNSGKVSLRDHDDHSECHVK